MAISLGGLVVTANATCNNILLDVAAYCLRGNTLACLDQYKAVVEFIFQLEQILTL